MAALGGRHGICQAVLLGRAALCRGTLAGKELAEGERAFSSGGGGREKRDESLFGEPPPLPSSPSPPGEAGSDRQRSTEFEENIFSFSSGPSASKSTEASSGETGLWKSLMKKPGSDDGEKKQTLSSSSSSPSPWDFLKDLNNVSTRPRSSTAQSSSSRPSFRKLADSSSGFDFLSETLNSPVRASEPSEQGPEEGSILHIASFKLLRDSFQKASTQPYRETVGIKSLNETLGLDSGSLFSSQETWSKPVDSRTLAEVEGNFYSTLDRSPAEDIKTYTYEELGEKLRQVRPPKEQLLFSATGLSFGELSIRLQMIEQIESEAVEEKDSLSDYKELKESLNHLRHKSLAVRPQLSYEELTFLNTVRTRTGSRVKIEYTPPEDELLTKYYSEEQLSSKERLKLEIEKLRAEFQTHETDSGSPQVQIAILTARINNLNRHLREGPNYKRDKHSRKGLNDMVQYRKRLLRYLRRRDWPVYCNVLTKMKLDDIILDKRG